MVPEEEVPTGEDAPVEENPAETAQPETTAEDTSPSSDSVSAEQPTETPEAEPTVRDGEVWDPRELTDAGNESAPSGYAPEEDDRTVEEKLNDLLADGKAAAKDTLKLGVSEFLSLSRGTLRSLIATAELPEAQQKAVALIYASAETHAMAGRGMHAAKMVKRATNLVKSHSVVVKAEKIEAAENYLSSILDILGSMAGGFVKLFGGPAVDQLAQIGASVADKWLDDLLGK